MKTTIKRYICKRCETISLQKTNHFGNTYSVGRFNTCSNCPPWAKYPEYGGSTTWICLEINHEAEATVTPNGIVFAL